MRVIVTPVGFERAAAAMARLIQRRPVAGYEVGTNEPYAWRIERGFHGTDSLGRYYNQAPRPYLLPAYQMHQPGIASSIRLVIMAGGDAAVVLEERALAIRDTARQLVAVDTGNLRGSIEVKSA